jgi:NAD(P)-dependent dehydrogenase (short-subunit alcohol dehydrogenase family)
MATILVVGADRGIAHAVALQLKARGDRVTAACLGGGEDLARENIDVEPRIDVTSDEDVARLAARLKARLERLDWVLHVAGVLGLDALGTIDFREMRRQLEINTLGPLRLAQAVLPLLGAGSKLGIVTSRVGSLADNASGGMYAYRVSKAGANMVALNLHHDLVKRGVAVVALHPGMVATELTKGYPGSHNYIQPAAAAAGLIRCMDELTLATSGQFRHAVTGEPLPW